ncbi:hypothetical protein CB1_000978011 [Camelus ferus]|nr:hypothetical protein CB1_000978011 [Camelus ferus]
MRLQRSSSYDTKFIFLFILRANMEKKRNPKAGHAEMTLENMPAKSLKNCGARDWDLTSIIRGRRPPSQEGCLASGSIGASGKSDVSAKSQESESRPLGFTICFMSYSSQHAWLSNFSISSAADVNTSAWGVFPRELRGL